MEDSDGIEDITHVHDPEKGTGNLDRVESSTGSDEKGKHQAVEQAHVSTTETGRV